MKHAADGTPKARARVPMLVHFRESGSFDSFAPERDDNALIQGVGQKYIGQGCSDGDVDGRLQPYDS